MNEGQWAGPGGGDRPTWSGDGRVPTPPMQPPPMQPPPMHQPPYQPVPLGPGPWQGGPPPFEPERPRRRRYGRWIAIALGTLLVLGGAGTAFVLWPPSTAEAVGVAADDVRTWEGVTHRAVLPQPGAGPVTIELSTDRSGDIYGVLTRGNGGRAEFVKAGDTELINGNRGWWEAEPDGQAKAARLAGIWLRPPAGSPAAPTSWLAPALPSPAGVLADGLVGTGGPPPAYAEPGDQIVDGVDGRVVEWPGHRAIVASGREPRLLAVVPAGFADPTGVRVVPAAPEVLQQVRTGKGRSSEAKNYDSVLYAPSAVQYRLGSQSSCDTPTCPVAYDLTNPGSYEARGFAVLLGDGKEITRTSFELGAGASRRVDLTMPNPAVARNVANVRVYLTVRIDPLP